MKRYISLMLCVLMFCAGCAGPAAGPDNDKGTFSDLMEGVEPRKLDLEPLSIGGEAAAAPMDFAVRLFQACLRGDGEGGSTVISPVSVLFALAMTANGARGATLDQMEKVFGMSVSELNAYLKAYADALPGDEKNKLSIADSIWFTSDKSFSVSRDFLQTNADYYGADICRLPFDESARGRINSWTREKTDGMIKEILDKIDPDAVMYLVNAVAFDAEWQHIYSEDKIRDGSFTSEDGTERGVRMMGSEEHVYLEDENATGFVKPYAGSKYAFAALLPKEGMSVREYAGSLTGKGLCSTLSGQRNGTVRVRMPKFKTEYGAELSRVLAGMGMPEAFDPGKADFSGLGSSEGGNICIQKVIHKTYMAVDEKGTRAGAATAVGMNATAMPPENIHEVVLDRPFVCMIIDCEAQLPLFIGAVTDITE